MKVLWITNRPISKAEQHFAAGSTSGTWMEPTLDSIKQIEDIHITVATVANCTEVVRISEDNVNYICLPKGKKFIYDYNNKKNLELWKQIINEVQPDIIKIWGTEYAHGLCALKCLNNIPSVIYIQGLIESVARYYFGSMTREECRQAISFKDIIKFDTLYMQYKKYLKRAKIEKQMISISKNVIIENEWATLHCKNIEKDCIAHQCELTISSEFYDKNWDYENCEKHSIMCSAPGYPLKGLHILIKALSIVKREFPNVKLKVPAMKNPFNQSFMQSLKNSGYTKYLKKLILQFDLMDNVVFLDRLTPTQMANHMESSNVFIVSSAIENHSSTLREAMIVGVPCVSSYVGGIPEIITNGDNALLYRFEEYEQLANNIISIIKNNDLAQKLSENGKMSMRNNHDEGKIAQKLVDIYKNIVKG